LRQKGDLEAAAREFRRAIELSPSDGPSLLNLAQILGLQGKTEESHQAMQRFVALRKDRDTLRTVQLYNDTGIRMVEQGDVNAGIGYFRAAVDLSPNSSEMHRNLAKALFQAGKLKEAGEEYTTAIRLNSRDWQAHCGLGEVLAQLDRLPESIKEVETGTQLNPSSAQAYHLLARVYQQAHDPARAEAAMARAKSLDPEGAHQTPSAGAEKGTNPVPAAESKPQP
jgi:tetratricopeptide (TPR) repeat protein